MNIFTKHLDTLAILAAILGSFLWMNGKFNDIEKDIAIIKTVMVMKGIMPESIATKSNETNIPLEHSSTF